MAINPSHIVEFSPADATAVDPANTIPANSLSTMGTSNFERVAADKAAGKLRAILTPEHYHLLSHTTIDDVRKALLSVEERLAKRRVASNMRRLQPLLERVDSYASIIEWFHDGIPMSHWICAPIQFVLMIAFDSTEAFQAIVRAYSRLSNGLPRVDLQIGGLDQVPQLELPLTSIFVNILEIHIIFYKFFQKM